MDMNANNIDIEPIISIALAQFFLDEGILSPPKAQIQSIIILTIGIDVSTIVKSHSLSDISVFSIKSNPYFLNST